MPTQTIHRRRLSLEVDIGGVAMGKKNPIRVQSMTTTDTLNVAATVAQIISLHRAGSEYVRLTVPSLREAETLLTIQKKLKLERIKVPIIADVHFTPNVAEKVARYVDKVRINPGNYADKKRFQSIDYSEQGYQDELSRLQEKFLPLVRICKEYGTPMRIGTNHGSLSDRIMSRYGDTPLGMVESALEFLRICHDENYHHLVLSMKASQPKIMVQAYRLLVDRLEKEQLPPYPLHLGVTEAGDGEDGRAKSAVGIGTLLSEGLGDTIRVSLTEKPENEIPVARQILNPYDQQPRTFYATLNQKTTPTFSPFAYQKRKTQEVAGIGGSKPPAVIADLSHISEVSQKDFAHLGYFYLPAQDKWALGEQACDFVLLKKATALPRGLKGILPLSRWQQTQPEPNIYPLLSASEWNRQSPRPCFVQVHSTEWKDTHLGQARDIILWVDIDPNTSYPQLRNQVRRLSGDRPLVLSYAKRNKGAPRAPYEALGAPLTDGIGDGVCLRGTDPKTLNKQAFNLLQATHTRISKTEYIACPSCGRTLFDLETTTAKIRAQTAHLKGLKIGIMGCIVNGPGEMADADYGYVGSGKGKITLYKGKEVVQRHIPENKAVDALIQLIKQHGDWVEKTHTSSSVPAQ